MIFFENEEKNPDAKNHGKRRPEGNSSLEKVENSNADQRNGKDFVTTYLKS